MTGVRLNSGHCDRVRGKRGARAFSPPALAAVCIIAAASQAAVGQQTSRAAPRDARSAFAAAYAAARAGTEPPSDTDSDILRAYPLYRYLQAARIERALEQAEGEWQRADERSAEFLHAHDGEPVAWPLRQAWLASLARRTQWQSFLEYYRPDTATPTLECLYLEARIRVGAIEGLAPAILAEWLTPNRLPTECEPVFTWLRAEGPLTDDLIEQRVRLLLGNGQAAFARVIAGRLPDERATPLLEWADLVSTPAEAIDALIASPQDPVEPDALLDGFSRLATEAPAAARARYDALVEARRPGRTEVSRLTRALALGLAWDRRSAALHFFNRVDADDVDDYALAWWARAALWNGEWRQAVDAIARMSPSQRGQSAWRYWAARAAGHFQPDDARPLYASLLPDDNYYSAMAAARLGRDVTPHAQPLRYDAAQVRRIAMQAPFVRARELLAAGMRIAALREWRYGLAALPAGLRPQSVHLADQWGWHDVTVLTATDEQVFYDYRLLYPEPYAKPVAQAHATTRLDTPLIYALLRQESLFNAAATSSAGALGLAQLLPDTARRVAAAWNEPVPDRAALLEPAVNVKLGAAHLRALIDAFDGQIAPGLAAYNAGSNNVEHWLPDRPVDADIWIENIPYNETRAYVRRVLWHSLVFKWLDTGRPQSTRSWLAPIRPRDSGAG